MVSGLSGKTDTGSFNSPPHRMQPGAEYLIYKFIFSGISQKPFWRIGFDRAYRKNIGIIAIAAAGLYRPVGQDKKYISGPLAEVILKPRAIPRVFQYRRLADRGQVYIEYFYE